jgi:hypothetical protein
MLAHNSSTSSFLPSFNLLLNTTPTKSGSQYSLFPSLALDEAHAKLVRISSRCSRYPSQRYHGMGSTQDPQVSHERFTTTIEIRLLGSITLTGTGHLDRAELLRHYVEAAIIHVGTTEIHLLGGL